MLAFLTFIVVELDNYRRCKMCNLKVKNRAIMNSRFSKVPNSYLEEKKEKLTRSDLRKKRINKLRIRESFFEQKVKANMLAEVRELNKNKIELLLIKCKSKIKRNPNHPVL